MTYMIPCFDEMGKYTSLQMQTDRQEIDDLLAYCRRLKLEVSCSLTKLHKDSGGVIMKYVYTIVGNGNALAFFKLRYIDQIAVIEEPDCAG